MTDKHAELCERLRELKLHAELASCAVLDEAIALLQADGRDLAEAVRLLRNVKECGVERKIYWLCLPTDIAYFLSTQRAALSQAAGDAHE
jgi:hypothetical protein